MLRLISHLRVPVDKSIYVRASRNDFHKLVDAFDRTSTERKRTISLNFNERITTTAILLKQTALHVSIIDYISDQVKRNLPGEEIKRAANYRLAKGLEPSFQLRYQKRGSPTSSPLIAFEVGFSQPSGELEQKVNALLNNTSTKVVVMFDFKEF
ncbi:hypothetical protein AJ80_03037 [Polytolypa hystricis UAMH7299]|uniref:Uncharacterized protein n=1 Tax=Polytolypa hystricis (strain UAMH7299) TaxID=1447883 RepID=A0A2B7YC01_POLH7|nr:hypothetical protein AJ80_03037 [Polytolypa hystricis UAMH7299]